MSPNDIAAPNLTGLSTPTMPTLGNGASLTGDISAGQNALSQLQQSTPTTQASPTSSGGILGDLKRLLPTIGAVAVPTIADLVTGGLAAPADIALAGLGGGLGQAAQNAAGGKSALSGNDLTTGLESAAGQAGGELLGKGLQAGGKFLTGQAAKAAETAEPTALDEATTIKNNYGGTKPGVQSANNMADNLDLLKSFGVDHTDPAAMQQSSNGGLFINNLHNEALASGAPIETSSLLSGGSNTRNLVQSVLKSSPEEQEALKNAGLLNDFNALPETVTPQQANQYSQELGAQLRDVRATMDNAQANGRVGDYNAAKTQYSKLETTYKNVQSKIGTPEVNQAIANRTITPEEKQALVDTYGQKQADYMESAVNNAKTHQDLVKAKLPFAQMNTISKQALGDMQAPATARGVARVAQSEPAATPQQSKGLLSKLPLNARGVEEVAGAIESLKGHPAIGLLLAAAGALSGSPEALGAGGSLLSKLGASPASGAAGAIVGSSPSTLAPAQGRAATMNGTNLQNSAVAVALNDALQQARIQAQYPFMPNSGSISSVLPTLIQAATQAGSAQQQAQNLSNMYTQAGGAQGPVMGLLSQLGQTFTGGPASLLNNQLGAQTQATQQAMGAAGATPGAMPSITENPQTANQALIGIRNLLSTLGGGQYSPTLGSL